MLVAVLVTVWWYLRSLDEENFFVAICFISFAAGWYVRGRLDKQNTTSPLDPLHYLGAAAAQVQGTLVRLTDVSSRTRLVASFRLPHRRSS